MDNQQGANTKAGGCTKVFLWVVGIFVGLAVLGAILGDPKNTPDVQTVADASNAAGQATNPGPEEASTAAEETDWSISEQKDELRGTTDKFASVTSENSVSFDFPYCCDSRLQITVRKTAQYGQDVIFQISDGQFVCGIYDCTGMISIDGKPEQLSLNNPADHDPKVLFAKYPDAIIKKLKSSSKVIVELPFYQEGNRQFTFETRNLEW